MLHTWTMWGGVSEYMSPALVRSNSGTPKLGHIGTSWKTTQMAGPSALGGLGRRLGACVTRCPALWRCRPGSHWFSTWVAHWVTCKDFVFKFYFPGSSLRDS